MEPIGAIIDAFRTRSLVALGDPHGNEQIQAFRLALIRDPRFAATVDDIVVEFGNARFQDAIDRFVRGEEVPPSVLKHVWQDTTQVEFEWELPPYEEFFRAVRAVNATLPAQRKLRVLLGDPPIDWSTIHASGDYMRFMENSGRDAYAVQVIQKEVLAKGKRALLIYGDQHLIRRNVVPNSPQPWARGLVAQLERPGIATVFTIHETRKDWRSWRADVTSWPAPSLALTKDTTIGAALFSAPPQRPVRYDDQFDALLYLGPLSAMTQARLSPVLCADRQYIDMRLARLALIPPPPGAPITPADLLKQECRTK